MTGIPKIVAQPAKDSSGLPQAIAELPQEQEAPEAIPYVISFENYNERACEILYLNSNKARKAIQTFKTVGTKICSTGDYRRYSVDRIPVKNIGEYKKLYNGLAPDVELMEVKLQEEARIFYFDIEAERTFYVVAITQNHLEIGKVRR